MNPVETFLTYSSEFEKLADKDLREKQKKELEMWHTWRDSGHHPDHLKPLMKSMQVLIDSNSKNWIAPVRDIPPSAIRAEFKNQFVQALHTYDPSRGVAINTHVTNYLKKARRFVMMYRNPARIPESRAYRIGDLQNAEATLSERYGRSPTQLEIADHLKWSPKQVNSLQREIRKSRPVSQFDFEPATFTPSRHSEILRLLPYELTSEERQVFEHIYGVGGKPKLSPGQISQTLNMNPSKVSRIKKSIAEKYKKYG